MSESVFTRRFTSVLKRHGAIVYPCVAGSFCPPGWPDRLVVHGKFIVLLEFKAERGSLSVAQEQMIKLLNAARPRAAFVVQEAASGGHIWYLDDKGWKLVVSFAMIENAFSSLVQAMEQH